MSKLITAALALGVLAACSSSNTSSAQCYAGCLCLGSDRNACQEAHCTWVSGDGGGYCANGGVPLDGSTD